MANLLSNQLFCSNILMISSERKISRWSVYICKANLFFIRFWWKRSFIYNIFNNGRSIPIVFFNPGKVWRISFRNFLFKQAEGNSCRMAKILNCFGWYSIWCFYDKKLIWWQAFCLNICFWTPNWVTPETILKAIWD